MARSWIGWSTSAMNNTGCESGFILKHSRRSRLYPKMAKYWMSKLLGTAFNILLVSRF